MIFCLRGRCRKSRGPGHDVTNYGRGSKSDLAQGRTQNEPGVTHSNYLSVLDVLDLGMPCLLRFAVPSASLATVWLLAVRVTAVALAPGCSRPGCSWPAAHRGLAPNRAAKAESEASNRRCAGTLVPGASAPPIGTCPMPPQSWGLIASDTAGCSAALATAILGSSM